MYILRFVQDEKDIWYFEGANRCPGGTCGRFVLRSVGKTNHGGGSFDINLDIFVLFLFSAISHMFESA